MTEIREPIFPPHLSGASHDPSFSTTGIVVLVLFALIWLAGLARCIAWLQTGIQLVFRRFSKDWSNDWKHRNWSNEKKKHPVIFRLWQEGFPLNQGWNPRDGYRYSFLFSTNLSPEFKTLDEFEAYLSSSPEKVEEIRKCLEVVKERMAPEIDSQPGSGKEEALPTPV